ncbi:MAG: thioredoxin-dependent thiol peroxidase [Candidatus Omnitrophota bacterium]|nr:thioredoxin-dependent thiol peroxidase [Candidatus Omnitrophota bacterium]
MRGESLRVGAVAPPFSLTATDGQTLSLSALRGKQVVLYFYPKDDTPGCTKEACSFRDHLSRFTRRGAVVLGVSRDDVASHQRFTQKFRLPFPLLSDPDAAVCKAYGVFKQKSLYGRTYWGIERTTFLIDERGRIARIFPKVKVDGHTEEILHTVKLRRAGKGVTIPP